MHPFQPEGDEQAKPPARATSSRPQKRSRATSVPLTTRALFQDEPEEKGPQKRSRESVSSTTRALFQDEPEEKEYVSGKGSSKAKSRPKPVLFGDEGEEWNDDDHAEESDLSEDGTTNPGQITFNLDWSAMQMFSRATLLKQATERSKHPEKKRPYDNSKRAANAASSTSQSYKAMALDPQRLAELSAKPQCKCTWA